MDGSTIHQCANAVEPAVEPFPARFARRVRQLSVKSGSGEIVVGEVVVVGGDGGGHDAVAVAGDAVAAGAWDLGDEPMTPKFDDESGDAFASSVGFVAVGGWSPVEAPGDLGVPEPADRVLAGEGGSAEPGRWG